MFTAKKKKGSENTKKTRRFSKEEIRQQLIDSGKQESIINLSTSKMCIDEKKLRFILSNYSVIRKANEACFELFSKIFFYLFNLM